VGSLPPILSDDEVARQLTTGLTATLAFRAETSAATSGKMVGGARVEIRYELWDEIFHVATLEIDGPPRRQKIPSWEELELWWSKLDLAVLNISNMSPDRSRQIRLTLDVLPFSHSEQLDTQKWFEESVQRAEQGKNEGISQSAEGGEESLGRVFSVLIATSIRRQALTSFHWTLPWPQRIVP
jgi:hypothetical protein